MWLQFILVALLQVAMLLVPGYLALRALGLPRMWSLCCGALVGLALVAGFAQALTLAGLPATPVPVLALAAGAPAVALALVRRRGAAEIELPRIWPVAAVASLALGAALGLNLYVERLGSPDALFQAYDVTQHLGVIRSMADSARLTSLGVSPYLGAADAAVAPVSLAGFYPAAWHSLCALSVMATGASVVVAINASMLVLPCLALPLAFSALLAALFPGSRRAQGCGALVCLAFAAFPWNLLAFGPVWPNVAGFSLMPAAMALFVCALGDAPSPSGRARLFGAVVVGAAGLALCHPNTIFTCVLLLSPYVVHRILDACAARGVAPARRALAGAGFALVVVAFWVVCFHLPFLQSTVTHVWQPFARAWQQVVNTLTLSYTYGFNVEIAAQGVLAALVAAGAVSALFSPGRRWLVASYALACGVLFASATLTGELKQLVAGFWYTDPMRLAANCAIAGVPLAALGLSWAYGMARRLVDAYNAPLGRAGHPRLVAGVTGAAFLLANFMPSFNLPGQHYRPDEQEKAEYAQVAEPRDWPRNLHTAFGDYRELAREVYSYDQPLDGAERSFAGRVAELVGDDELIVNNPMDGSFLTYGTDGLRLYYRNFIGFETETDESRTLRLHLSEYATSPEVRAAVEAVDARYVLQMNGDESEASFINMRGNYDAAMVEGITSITPETEGFELVAREGDLALYRIER